METNGSTVRNLEEMEWNPKNNKKRGRREEEQEDFYYNYYLHQLAKKQDTITREHCNNNVTVRGKTEYSISCSRLDDSHSYISSENHVALGVFDFPWMHEGVVSKSEDRDYLEDTFSSLLETTCFRSGIKFSECLYETSPATAQTNFDEDKRVFNESDDVHRLGFEGADCIWGSLLNQPLQLQQGVPNPSQESLLS